MPRTVETTVYQFDELSDKAKDKARAWYREASEGDNYFAESVLEDAAKIAELMGIEIKQRSYRTVGGKTGFEPSIYWSGFWSQGDGASFEGTYSAKPNSVQSVTEYAPTDEKLHAIARELEAASLAIPGEWRAVISQSRYAGNYSHSGTMQIEIEQETDADGNAPEFELQAEKALLAAFRSFADWIYRGLEAEYNYQNSDEQVDETIRANEYEFTVEGKRA